MSNLNNKGFTLVEVIAVVAIIAIIAIILIPNVGYLIGKQKDNSIENVKNSILVAAQEFVTDNRYNISLNGGTITKIGNINITGGEIPVSELIGGGYLNATKGSDRIVNPNDRNKCLSNNPVIVSWNSTKKKYNYEVNDLVWDNC